MPEKLDNKFKLSKQYKLKKYNLLHSGPKMWIVDYLYHNDKVNIDSLYSAYENDEEIQS